jgi:hypothetical protein
VTEWYPTMCKNIFGSTRWFRLSGSALATN